VLENKPAVLSRLSEGLTGGPPAYLALRAPRRNDWCLSVLSNLRSLIPDLRDAGSLWADLIVDVNWRFTLVGCSAVLVDRNTSFLSQLLYRLKSGSWVAPHLAVSLGLVHPDRATPALEEVLRDGAARPNVRNWNAVYSAYEVLKIAMSHDYKAEYQYLVEDARTDRVAAHESTAVASLVPHLWSFWSAPPAEGQSGHP
jgi:hypothetical protein